MLGSLVFTTTAMTVTNLFCLFLIGDLTDTFVFPVMIAARYITIADFLQHIESLIIAIWIFGIFVKISVFYISLLHQPRNGLVCGTTNLWLRHFRSCAWYLLTGLCPVDPVFPVWLALQPTCIRSAFY